MTPDDADPLGGLAGFRERMLGGVHRSLSATRRLGQEELDAKQFLRWPAQKPCPLTDIRDVPWNPGADEPQATIKGFTEELRKDRQRLAAVVFSPHLLLRRLIGLCGSSDQDLADSWMAMCWIAEGAWDALAADLPGSAGYAVGDAELLRPVAARLRFLVLSEPMRFRGQTGKTLWHGDSNVFGGSGVFDRTFGPDSWTDLVGRCREARREWQDCLDTYQSRPLLTNSKPEELEHELRTSVFSDGARPLVLSVAPLPQRAPLAPEDTAVIADSVDRHLLPRFAIGMVTRLALYDDDPLRQWARRLLAAAVMLTGLGAVGCAAWLRVHPAVWLAAACYALICAGVVVLPGSWGAMWLLRMPAASAVGIFALTSFLPGGWLQAPPGGWGAAAVLTAVSFGYLLVEVRNHGVATRSAVPRALLVVAVGAVHALMVSMIGMIAVAPALVANGGQMSKNIWAHPGYGHAGVVLAIAAAWCLTVGVFLQILWDERPITAPLAHLSWRR